MALLSRNIEEDAPDGEPQTTRKPFISLCFYQHNVDPFPPADAPSLAELHRHLPGNNPNFSRRTDIADPFRYVL